MFRLSAIYLFALLFIACSSPMEKTVIESLSAKEIDKVAGEDKSFLATYSIVEEKSNYIHTYEDSARWASLTYGRLHNFITTIESDELNTPLLSSLRKRWNDLYVRNNAGADSLISYWNDYLDSNNPDSLLTVLYEGIEVERIRNANRGIDTLIKAKIKLKSHGLTIDSVLLSYSFDSLVRDTVIFSRRISDSSLIKVFPSLSYHTKSALMAEDSSVTFNSDIISLYSNAMCYNMDSLKGNIPECILDYIGGNGSKEQIVKEMIDSNFVSLSAYLRHNAQEYYRQTDSLAYSYIIYRGEQ